MKTETDIPLPPDRSYTRRIDDATAALVDAMLPGHSIYVDDSKLASCVIGRMRNAGWATTQRKEGDGIRVWRKL